MIKKAVIPAAGLGTRFTSNQVNAKGDASDYR